MTAHAIAHHSTASSPHRDDGVTGWRAKRLLEVGFEPDLAQQLASTPGVDLHALLDLVGRGCPPRLAARILSPVDDEDQRA